MGDKTEEYWNSTQKPFDFDEDDTNKFTFDIQNKIDEDSIFRSYLDESQLNVLPIHSLITKHNLDCVLNDILIPTYSVSAIQETISNIILEKPYSLDMYRSLEHKTELLESAISTKDGNVILRIVVFLESTLKPDIFQQLMNRKEALSHYTNYLISRNKHKQLEKFFIATENYPKLLPLFYLSHRNIYDQEDIKRDILELTSHCHDKMNNWQKCLIIDYNRLLEWQIVRRLPMCSPIQQLVLLCKMTWEKNSGKDEKDIIEFKKQMKLTNFQYEWTQLNILSVLKMWDKIYELFVKQNWLTKNNVIKSAINAELFVQTLHRHNAPQDSIEKFLPSIVDVGRSLDLAKKMKCHRYVINTYTNQRDRANLLKYKANLTPHSEEYFLLEGILYSSDKKWKN